MPARQVVAMGAAPRRATRAILVVSAAVLLAGTMALVTLAGVVAGGTVAGDTGLGGTGLGAAPGPGGGPGVPGDGPGVPGPSRPAPAIPGGMLALYRAAAGTCPGLPWTVLAGIGTVESDNGQSSLPGVHSGANGAGAEGPMQFEPATFAAYDQPVPPGGVAPPTPYDPTDAVYAAARLLCADGARGGAALAAAVFAYNHSLAYVDQVFAVAASLGGP